MRFIPEYKLNIIKEVDFPEAIKQIEARLEPCRNSGFFDSFDGKKLYFEYFLAENSVASVVIVHGLSEFTKKYYEMAYYFLNQGYNVFVFDQRCHGKSCRLTDNTEWLHVDDFDDYVKDLELFINNIVLPTDNKPLYIYTHSMGGAITMLYLAKNCDMIERAVLSAPLFEPIVGKVSTFVAKCAVKYWKFKHGSKSKFKFSSDFDPEVKHNPKVDSSKARFEHNIGMRRNNREYQSGAMTLGWVNSSLAVRKKIMRSAVRGKYKLPLLLFSAENDTVVNLDAHYEFDKKCKTCQLISV